MPPAALQLLPGKGSVVGAVLTASPTIAGVLFTGSTVGSVAKSVVGALIPFRGVIREISGANKHEREFQDAIMAGVIELVQHGMIPIAAVVFVASIVVPTFKLVGIALAKRARSGEVTGGRVASIVHFVPTRYMALMPGTIHALVGENGAGKSSLAKVLARQIERDFQTLEFVENGLIDQFKAMQIETPEDYDRLLSK